MSDDEETITVRIPLDHGFESDAERDAFIAWMRGELARRVLEEMDAQRDAFIAQLFAERAG